MRNLFIFKSDFLLSGSLLGLYCFSVSDLDLLYSKRCLLDSLKLTESNRIKSVNLFKSNLSDLEFLRVHDSMPNSIRITKVYNRAARLVNFKLHSKSLNTQAFRLPYFLKKRFFKNRARFKMLYSFLLFKRSNFMTVRDPLFFYNFKYFYDRKGSFHALSKYNYFERAIMLRISGYNSYNKIKFGHVYTKFYKHGGLNTKSNNGLIHKIKLALHIFFKMNYLNSNYADQKLFKMLESEIFKSSSSDMLIKYKQDKFHLIKFIKKIQNKNILNYKQRAHRTKPLLKNIFFKNKSKIRINTSNKTIRLASTFIKHRHSLKMWYFISFDELTAYTNLKIIKWPYLLEDKQSTYVLKNKFMDIARTSRYYYINNNMRTQTHATLARIAHFRGFLFQKEELNFTTKYRLKIKISESQSSARAQLEDLILSSLISIRFSKLRNSSLGLVRAKFNKFFQTKPKPRLKRSRFRQVYKYANFYNNYKVYWSMNSYVRDIHRSNSRFIGLNKFSNKKRFNYSELFYRGFNHRAFRFYLDSPSRPRDLLFNLYKYNFSSYSYLNLVLDSFDNSVSKDRLSSLMVNYNSFELYLDIFNLLYPELELSNSELRLMYDLGARPIKSIQKSIDLIKSNIHNKSVEQLEWLRLTNPDGCFMTQVISLLSEGRLNIMLLNYITLHFSDTNIILMIDFLNECLKTKQVLMDYTPSVVEIAEHIEVYKLLLILRELEMEIASSTL